MLFVWHVLPLVELRGRWLRDAPPLDNHHIPLAEEQSIGLFCRASQTPLLLIS